MPYYEIPKNPGNFSVTNPKSLINENIKYIKQGFNQKNEIIVPSFTGTTILAKDMISGWIVRDQFTGPSTDLSDTAVNIYNALGNTLTSSSNGDFGVKPGFYFDYGIYNEGFGTITYQSGDPNVIFGRTSTFSIPSGAVGWFRAVVTSTTGPTEVYISQLSN